MKSYILILCFLVQFSGLIAQEHRIVDSLKLELRNISQRAPKFDILTQIFESYLFTDLDSANIYKSKILLFGEKDSDSQMTSYSLASKYHYYKYELDSALYYLERALELSIKSNNNILKADSYRKMAILYSRKSEYIKAEKYGNLALKSAKSSGDWNLIASAYTMLGNQFFKKNNYDIALEYYLDADSIYSSNNKNDRSRALISDNIGNIYANLKDKRALDYIEKSAKIYQKENDVEGLNYSYILNGIYYQTMGEPQKAITFFTKALKFYEKYGNAYRKNEVYTRLLNSFSALGDFINAERFLQKSELLNHETENTENLLELNLNAGQLYLDQKKYEKALLYFEKASAIINKSNTDFSLSTVKSIHSGLAQSYFGIKDFKTAYAHKQKQISTIDSIYKKNSIDITNDLEAKYQTQKKEQEIALLKSQNEFSEQQKKSQRNLLLVGIGITSLAGMLLFILYKNRLRTNQKLREVDILKTNFFTNISHELRTPLTLISAPIQEILEEPNLSDEKRSHLQIAKNNTKRLSDLIDQLLELSKIDSGNRRLSLEKTRPTELISAWNESFIYLGKQKNIDFELEIRNKEIEAWCDREALENIVTNLFGNAIKYTPKNGKIKFKADIEENTLKIEVANSGKGLTKNQLKTIFNRFYQTDNYSEGAGIGLSLIKELTDLHGGSITVKSNPNNWTTFTAVLNLDKNKLKNADIKDGINTASSMALVQDQIPTQEIIITENKNQPILLIVEDNADMRTVLSDTFKETFEVILAENGEKGIALAIEQIPDIIISDLMMPIKDGIELTKTLKEDEHTCHIPIILLTAKAGDENELIGINVGADDYTTKPFNQKILKSKVNNLIQLRQKLQSRYSHEVILRPKDLAVTSVDERFLEKVQEVLDNNLIESTFTIEAFSTAVQMSRMQLHRKLKALTGLSASEFIRSQRLKLAANILKQSDINVSQVGYSVGFNDHAYFSKCFKEAYKCTPSDFAAKK